MNTPNIHSIENASIKTFLVPFVARILPALLLLSGIQTSQAGSATWSGQPINGNWNNSQNWSPQTVPNGPSDVATFGSSLNRSVSLSANTEVNGITFTRPSFPTAVNYGITVSPTLTLTISGTGITNNSGQAQNFVIAAGATNVGEAQLFFTNSATAGSAIFTNNAPAVSGVDGGVTEFSDSSTAGNSTFINNASGEIKFYGTASAGSGTFTNNGGAGMFGGGIDFEVNSTAANATFVNNGGTSNGAEGRIFFGGSATAESATFTNNGASVSGGDGGLLEFFVNSSAGSATLIGNGGTSGGGGGLITFLQDAAGGFARVEVFGNGSLDISGHNAPGVDIGSIQGNGIVFLGANNLTVGLNSLSTVFSGVMQDGGSSGGTGGSLTKLGGGKLTLSTGNFYTGPTALNGGALLVKNKTGSATGNNAVQVNNGTLEGTGKISGAVTIGNGSLSGAILLAGNSAKKPGTLTINNTLTFNSFSTYKCVLNRTSGKASEVTAVGVTINSGVPLTFVDTGSGTLAKGTVFTIINNNSANPIAGTFSNLANGSTFSSNGNNFKVSYTGGTGNDLTLKVVQ